MNPLRYDLRIIASWITPGAKVLELGCGEGDLLLWLRQNRQVTERGIEIKESKVVKCIEKGISVLQGISTGRSWIIRTRHLTLPSAPRHCSRCMTRYS